MITRDDVLRALEGVDASGVPLAKSGRIGAVLVDGGRITFTISIDASEAAAFEIVRRRAEDAVRSLPGATQVLVGLTAERPPGSSGGDRARAGAVPTRPGGAAPPPPQSIPGIRHIVAVASGKGGVGKSTLACNLALALKADGLRVGLLDADIYGPSAPKLFGLTGRKPRLISGRILEPIDAFGVSVMSIGFLVDEDQAMIWRGPMVMSAITQMLREVAWNDLDILIVDMPPGTGDAQLTMAQATPLAGAVIVSTPQDLALIDARRGIAMFRKVAVPILGIVENMATFVCPHCGGESHVFGHGGARREAERLSVPFLGEIPLAMPIRETSDAGAPLVATDPAGTHAVAFRQVATTLWTNLQGVARPVPKIVIETSI